MNKEILLMKLVLINIVRGRSFSYVSAIGIALLFSLFFRQTAAFCQASAVSLSADTLNFGRLRIGNTKSLTDTLTAPKVAISFKDTNYQHYIHSGQFTVDTLPRLRNIIAGQQTYESARFHPLTVGTYLDNFYISFFAGSNKFTDSLKVYLYGRGVNYRIPDTTYSFLTVRLATADTQFIPITNFGDDTTLITSITLENKGDFRDFGILPDSLPTPKAWRLDTAGSGKNMRAFHAFFLPKYDSVNSIIDTGVRQAIVDIVADDGVIRHDTLLAIGAEPWIVSTDSVIDFGTISNAFAAGVSDTIIYDTIVNSGTMQGILDSLRLTDTTFFSIKTITLTPLPDNSSLGRNGKLVIAIIFHISQTGDFVDTIEVHNDSRNKPLVILRSKVRAGIAPLTPVSLGTVSTCVPIDTTIILHNPFKVSVEIDSFWIEGNMGGFDLSDLDTNTKPHLLTFPVFIDADSIFTLHIHYRFPADSANGIQTAKIVIERPSGNKLSLSYDTAIITLTRKIVLLNFSSVLPPFSPSAGDQPFKLPIHLIGDRITREELNNDTLVFQFSNSLIRPVGIDRTGSLTESKTSNPLPPQPSPFWDEPTLTYHVPCVGLNLSTDSSKNTLIFTLLCSAYLTKDTVISITPVIHYVDPPCAFHVVRDSTIIIYANECGNRTIRDILLSGLPIEFQAPMPNPVRATDPVLIPYLAQENLLISWKLYDERGYAIGESSEQPIPAGTGNLTISMKQTVSPGAHYLQIKARDPKTGTQLLISLKLISVQ